MASPVKVSDRLLAQAKQEAIAANRSATAQIEHWATLGRAVEAYVAYRDVLALKSAGATLPMPSYVARTEVSHALMGLTTTDRDEVKARIQASGTPLYAADPEQPGTIIEIHPDGTRIRGHLEGRRFVPRPRSPSRRN